MRQQNKLSRSGRPTGHADMTRVLCTPQQLSRGLVGKVENGLGTTIFIYVVHIDLMIDKPGESGYTSAHILHASAIAAKYGHARNPRFCNLEALPRVPMQQCPKLRSQVCPSRHFSPCVLLSYTTCFIATGGALAPRQGSSPTPGQRCDLFKGGSGRASERIYKIKVNNRESQAQKPT